MQRVAPVHSTGRITEVIRILILPLRYRGRTCEGCRSTLSRSRWTSWCSNGSTSGPPHSIGFGMALHLPLFPPQVAQCSPGSSMVSPPCLGKYGTNHDARSTRPGALLTTSQPPHQKKCKIILLLCIPLPFPSYFPKLWTGRGRACGEGMLDLAR